MLLVVTGFLQVLPIHKRRGETKRHGLSWPLTALALGILSRVSTAPACQGS